MVLGLLKQAAAGHRLSFEEGVQVYKEADLLDLGWAANEVKRRYHKDD